MKDNFLKSLGLCLLSALLLGVSEPLLMPALFGSHPAPEFFGLLALVGYVPLFSVLLKSNIKQVFFSTFFTLTAQYTIVLFWIYIALHVYGHIAPLPASAITLLLPMILALMGAVFFSLARFLSLHYKKSFLLYAPLALCAAEYFRNYYLFGGFPWGHAGYSIARVPEFLQLASLVGIYGLVFFVGLVNALVLAIFRATQRKRQKFALALLLLLCSVYIFGALQLRINHFAPSVRVALLQGNIEQEIKSNARLYVHEILKIYDDLHKEALAKEAQIIVWPESGYPLLVDQKRPDLELKLSGAASIVGATTYRFNDENKFSYYQNSAFLLNYQSEVVARYDKSHLVPFGEYVPWPMANIVDKVVPGMGAFRPGKDFIPVNLALNHSKSIDVGTTICYEGIFPEISRAYANNGAKLLVNITNDAWYGESSAPLQHLLMYQLRAVESGRPYVRATNSGISAFIDDHGRIQKSLGLFERGLIVADIPLNTRTTIYMIIGDIVPILCALLLTIIFLWAVIPLRSMLKKRQWKSLALVIFFLSVGVAAYIYFSRDIFLIDESARTKKLFIIILSFVMMFGSIAKSARSRAILLSVATLVIFLSVLLAVFESLYFLLGLIVGVLIYLMAFRMSLDEKTLQ
ncbi:MAG: apolipoprotein N-acyltransferase [Myxococcales bacterium]|nr:MAG: apolipoprotein N-acyltransferase [Myxococcales bacterium]